MGLPDRMAVTEENTFENLIAEGIEVLQANIGYACNLGCKHCHIDANREREESMTRVTMDAVLTAMTKYNIKTLDITGGAPELNEHFRYLVRKARQEGFHVIARTNLAIFYEPGFEDLPDFYRSYKVEIVASLPHYTSGPVDRIRGAHAFQKSISALQHLNVLGYGTSSGDLGLSLVYNPPGAVLPDAQEVLEACYRKTLEEDFGVTFDRLFVFANVPAGRFLAFLTKSGGLRPYMDKVKRAFNPETLAGLMCRRLINVGWDGALYDCDFNQALCLPVRSGYPRHISEFDYELLAGRFISTGEHCYVCAAGQGST